MPKPNSPQLTYSPDSLMKQLKAAAERLSQQPSADPIACLAANKVRSPIILTGSQHIRVKRLVDWLREKFFSAQTASFSSYFSTELTSEGSLRHIKNSLGSMSLLSRAQLLVLYDADKIKAALAHTVLQAIEEGYGNTLLLLTASSFNQKSVLISKLVQDGTLVQFTDLDQHSLQRWIEKEVQRWNASGGIELEAIALLIKTYGSDVCALAQEISKLALLCPAGEKISRRLVEQISLRSPEANSFALIAELARKNAPACVALCRLLVEQGLHPLQVNAFLSKSIRTLLAQGAANIPPDLHNPWFLRNLSPAARAFSKDELQKALDLLSKLDFNLKDSKLPDQLVLANTVQRIALRAFE